MPAVTYDEKYQQQVFALATGMGGAMVDGVTDTLGLKPSGAKTPSDEELAAFFFHQNTLYPPQDFVYPDGHHVFASPWILALEFTSNGDEWVRRFERFRMKAGA